MAKKASVLEEEEGLANPLDYNTFSAVGPEHFGADMRHSMPLRSVVYHIFKGNVGAGVFLLPTFYQESGSLLGILVTLALGYIIVDSAIALIEVKHMINDPQVTSYPGVVQHVLGSGWRMYTNFALAFSQFGFCVMYLQYSASMISAITDGEAYEEMFLVFCLLIVTPLTFLTHRMELLAYGSLIAGLCVVGALLGTAVVACQSISTDGISETAYSYVLTPRILLMISGYLFSLEGIGMVLPIENCLHTRDKPKFSFYLRTTLYSIIVLYLLFGVVGYLAYGKDLTTSVILALPRGPLKSVLEFLVAVSLILSFPVQYVPAIQLIDSAMGVSMVEKWKRAICVRLGINLILGFIAGVFGPEALNMVASFIGAFGGVHLMITIPVLLVIFVDGANERQAHYSMKSMAIALCIELRKRRKGMRIFYLFFTLLIWCGGIFYTCLAIYNGSRGPQESVPIGGSQEPIPMESIPPLL